MCTANVEAKVQRKKVKLEHPQHADCAKTVKEKHSGGITRWLDPDVKKEAKIKRTLWNNEKKISNRNTNCGPPIML